MIIVIEGFDQAGKRTQSQLLAKALRAKKLKCKIFSFPDYTTPLGKEIKYYLSGRRKFPPQVIHCLLAQTDGKNSRKYKNLFQKIIF